jgi:hypothetical protein
VNNYNYSEFESEFCENNFYKFINENSATKCRKACVEELYEIWNPKNFFIKTNVTQKLSSHYIAFENESEIKFHEFLMNFGGLLGLWHELSLIII